MKASFLSLFFFIFMGGGAFAQTSTDSFLVAPYLQWSTQSSMHILWETERLATSRVVYGEAQLDAEEANLEKVTTLEGQRHLHEVKISDLKPATKYLYQVISTLDNGVVLRSDVSTFKTSVESNDAYCFALVGDSQYSSSSPGAWGRIATKVWEERPNFILHVGDLVDVGTRKTDWTQQFFPEGAIAMSRFPMYTVLGNHEQDASFYYDYMVNPEPEYYYTFHYGNAQFFMIDTNRDVSEGSEQYDWLEWALAQSTATWKFVVHHHPPYSSEENDHGDTYLGASSYGTHARNLVPLYDTYGVDFCLYGHTHLYERSWPLANHKINLQNGVVYINSGGAGGGLEDFDPVRSWFTQELQTGHHYCTFSVFDGQLVFKAVDENGRMFDSFQLNKTNDGQVGMMRPPAPHVNIDKKVFQTSATISLAALDSDYRIFYTLDGSLPHQQSTLYTGPFKVTESCELQVICYTPEGKSSRIVTRELLQMEPLPALKITNAKRGLSYQYYEGEWKYLPDFEKLEAVKTGVCQSATIEEIEHRENNFGVVLEGYVDIPTTDTYTFYTYSDDGSKLYLDGKLLVDSDGLHSAKYIYGTTILEKGKHRLRIEYFEGGGNNFIYAGLVNADHEKIPFSPFQLSH